MSEQTTTRKLRNYFINRKVQLKLIAITFLHMSVLVLVTIAIFLSPLLLFMRQMDAPELKLEAARFYLMIVRELLPVVCVVFALSFCHLIFVSHQFCGPVINFRHTLKLLADGDFTRKVHLRKRDYLKEEGLLINTVVDNVAGRITALRDSNRRLLASLEQGREGAEGAEAISQALHHARQMEEQFALFHLPES